MPASRERGCVCVCVSFFRLHRGEEGRVAASHSPELAGQDRHQEHEDALFAYAETNQRLPAVGRGRGWWRAHASATVSGDAIQKASARLAAHGFFRVVSIVTRSMALQLCAVSRSLEMCIEIRLRLENRPVNHLATQLHI